MAITINGSGTITGLSTGGLPDGSVDADTLATDAVTAAKLKSDAITAGDLPAGSILQVVQSTKTDTDSMSGLGFDDLGLSVTITPSSSTSKVLILCFASIAASSGYDVKLRLLRGSSPILVGDTAGDRVQATTAMTGNWTTVNYFRQNASINYLDSPATTSATTYKLQASSYVSGVNIYINRGHNDNDRSDYEARAASSMIALEVAA